MFYPWVRQFTGTGFVYRAYVRTKPSNNIVMACEHRHRFGRTAERCAARLVRMMKASKKLLEEE